MKRLPWTLVLLAASPAYGGVQYYLTDRLTSVDPAKWATTGSVSANAAGLMIADANGGSLVSKVPIPDGSNEAEVDATITLSTSGGVYTEFMQASAGARTSLAGGGSYIAFEMQNPRFDAAHNCMAAFLVFQSLNGTVSLISAFQHACRNGMVMRLAVRGNTALVWPDDPTPVEFSVTAGAGQPGIGAYSMPAGNAITEIQLGAIARTPPNAVEQRTIGVSAFRNRVDIQWQAVSATAVSPGIAAYWIYRDGSYFARTTNTHFSDEAVTPGAKHTYTIYAVDQHFNQSVGTAVTVSTPTTNSK